MESSPFAENWASNRYPCLKRTKAAFPRAKPAKQRIALGSLGTRINVVRSNILRKKEAYGMALTLESGQVAFPKELPGRLAPKPNWRKLNSDCETVKT